MIIRAWVNTTYSLARASLNDLLAKGEYGDLGKLGV